MKRSLIALMALTLAGCPKSEDADTSSGKPARATKPSEGSQSGLQKKNAKAPEKKPASSSANRAGLFTVRSLVRESPRAEVLTRGYLIDLGTPDQHKYVSPWAESILRIKQDGRNTFAEVGPKTELVVTNREERIDRVLVRARSKTARQKITLYVDGKKVSSKNVLGAWSEVGLKLKSPLGPGRHTIGLHLNAAEGQVAADIDWVWLGPKIGEAPVVEKVKTRTYDTPRQALVGDPPRTISYYLSVPKDGFLVFDYASKGPAEFEVKAKADGKKEVTLFSERTEGQLAGARWRGARVDLSKLAGQMVRLDLTTRGEAIEASWGAPEIARQGQSPRVPPIARASQPKNLVYILIDTVRADVYKPFNRRSKVDAPAFDKLAKSSAVFTNAYTPAPWTKPSVATLMSSLYPTTHGAQHEESRLSDAVPLISEHLKNNGFETALISANGYVSEKFGFKRGWDFYRNYAREGTKSFARQFYGDAQKWLEGREDKDKRFFMYLQAIDPHVPYSAPAENWRHYFTHPPPYRGPLGDRITGFEHNDFNNGKLKLDGVDRDFMIAQYWGEITYHDIHFGKFIDYLEAQGLLDDTLIVVSNDHGEELFDHGALGHGQSLHEELVRCPLMIRYPKLVPAKEVTDPVGLVDIAPTILELMGLPQLPLTEGLSLVGLMHDRPRMTPGYAIAQRRDLERSVRLAQYKLIASRDEYRLFDLDRDPRERRNLVKTHPIAFRAAEIHLQEGLHVPQKSRRLTSVSGGKRFEATKADIDPKLMEHLKALGYFNN